jgi:glutamate 5-kinase
MAGGVGSALGRGGMLTKILAAKKAALSGAATVIAYGRVDNVLIAILDGEAIGTRLASNNTAMQARKMWLAGHLKTMGTLTLDAGAASALISGGKSLLPIGVTAVEGEFARGDVVSAIDPSGREIARGLCNYGAGEARRIARKPTKEIEATLGYVAEAELIHRDNLVLV